MPLKLANPHFRAVRVTVTMGDGKNDSPGEGSVWKVIRHPPHTDMRMEP